MCASSISLAALAYRQGTGLRYLKADDRRVDVKVQGESRDANVAYRTIVKDLGYGRQAKSAIHVEAVVGGRDLTRNKYILALPQRGMVWRDVLRWSAERYTIPPPLPPRSFTKSIPVCIAWTLLIGCHPRLPQLFD